jgi:hypothetical protein
MDCAAKAMTGVRNRLLPDGQGVRFLRSLPTNVLTPDRLYGLGHLPLKQENRVRFPAGGPIQQPT